MTRQDTLHRLRKHPDQPVSVLIIGGGVNGIGTFRDLALQGVDVLLAEKSDFCSGASAASSHMAHGGLRYLENGEFRLVREALTERNRLLHNAPHAVFPLPTTIPIFKRFSGFLNAPLKFLNLRDKPGERGSFVIKIGLTFYDLFTRGQQTLPPHRFFSRAESLAKRPELNPNILTTAQYYDAWMPYPERICVEMVLDAEAANPQARALNYVSVEGADRGRVTLRDEHTNETFTIQPKIVINAAGPWIDLANQDLGRTTQMIGGTKGSHIVVDHPQLHALTQGNEMFFENADGRICLFFPLQDRVLIGTTDIRINHPDEARITEEEIEYMLGMVRHVFPTITLDRSDVVFWFTGVRPLPNSNAASAGQISRDHSIQTVEADEKLAFPVLALVGGKWTTFRAFSEQVTDAVLKRLKLPRQTSTEATPIGGGKDYPTDRAAWFRRVSESSGLGMERLETLFTRYGTRAEEIAAYIGQNAPDTLLEGVPDGYTKHEVTYIVQHERVEHLDDFLLRRSLLAMLGKVNAVGLRNLAGVVGEALDWDAARVEAEITRTAALLHERHGVKVV